VAAVRAGTGRPVRGAAGDVYADPIQHQAGAIPRIGGAARNNGMEARGQMRVLAVIALPARPASGFAAREADTPTLISLLLA
jgi:hypothetical protein